LNSFVIELLSGIKNFLNVKSLLAFDNFSILDFLKVSSLISSIFLFGISLDFIRDYLLSISSFFELGSFIEFSVEFGFSLSELFDVSIFIFAFLTSISAGVSVGKIMNDSIFC